MYFKEQLMEKISNNSAIIGIIGLGYVGLPLALTFAEKGFRVIGFDIDESKIPILNSGKSYIKHISEIRIKNAVYSEKLEATTDFSLLNSCDVILICVPTPLNEHREPDMTYIENSGKLVAEYFRKGQLIVLESSTYPGTTGEILLPKLELAAYSKSLVESDSPIIIGKNKPELSTFYLELNSAKKGQLENNEQQISTINQNLVGEDFFLAFSPEREDPNNPDYSTSNIPKVVGGVTQNCLEVARTLYDKIIIRTVPVSSEKVAEATKLLENIYRSINIALVNELKMIFDRMDIDIWEVIEAAKTKPFGFHAFYPGPGLGGHCIPIDPFYLSWKAREHDIPTRFIELAGEINCDQPYYVVKKASEALNERGKCINGAKILILGVAYKKNVDDMRESPSLKLIQILKSKGAIVNYNDPYVPRLTHTRKYKFDMESILESSFTSLLPTYDFVLLCTDHDSYDYKLIAENSQLIIDTRNAFASRKIYSDNIYKA